MSCGRAKTCRSAATCSAMKRCFSSRRPTEAMRWCCGLSTANYWANARSDRSDSGWRRSADPRLVWEAADPGPRSKSLPSATPGPVTSNGRTRSVPGPRERSSPARRSECSSPPAVSCSCDSPTDKSLAEHRLERRGQIERHLPAPFVRSISAGDQLRPPPADNDVDVSARPPAGRTTIR